MGMETRVRHSCGPISVGCILGVVALLLICDHAFGESIGEQEAQRLVWEAQETFETGCVLHEAGQRQLALEMFERSHLLLLRVESKAVPALRPRISNIFKIFYRHLEQLYPDMAKELRNMRDQTEKTFNERPSYDVHVQRHINYLVNNKRSFLVNSFRKSLQYIPMIQEEFARQGIPPDLAYMALIESGFHTSALSSAGARGLWQFMPATAKRFGLVINETTDERLDPVKATKAAALYLKTLYGQFGSWPLAVAAYNCGEGRVSNAIARTGAACFWELANQDALPRETRLYVPSIIAVTLISRNPQMYGLPSQ